MSDARLNMTRWVQTAIKTVEGAYGAQLDWERKPPERVKALDALDFYLGAYFFSTMEGGPTVTLEQVTDAWRVYWKLFLTGQQELI